MPIYSMRNWRDSSLAVPASQSLGPTATGAFCTISASGSRLVTGFFNEPIAVVTGSIAMVSVIGALFVSRRLQLREALQMYRQHFKTFAGLGALSVPIGGTFNGFAFLVRNNPPMEWVIKWLNDTDGARLTSAATVGGVQQIAMALLVAPPIIVAVRDIREGRQPSIRQSFRRSYSRLGLLATSLTLVLGSVTLLSLVVILIPVAIWLSVRWQFFAQAALLDGADSAPGAVRESQAITTGHWWKVLGDTVLFQFFSLIPGPLVGLLLLLVGNAAINFANGLSSILFAITVPITTIGLTLAYERYRDNVDKSTAVNLHRQSQDVVLLAAQE